ncbi:helix-turn-helix domain-containing protein [Myxococcus sp. K38C18041901]|uniref:helix-turn-helix transcriptional regulator n=1 Tax=Myxococcus guangdongensis TaxID=2906760 RepID=UPI0020A7DD63|nr:AraC family transcriptional regulator [Myxococcus guangdongensis]MCP3061588.1 helix-turn-helix domain-containing protein [Myxococcus guangdongensis]
MLPERAPGYHVLEEGDAFDVSDCVCRAGCHSPVVEGMHTRVCVSVVLSGVFHARGPEGDAVVGPGALLLGNRAAPYEFRHVDEGGDRSLVIECSDAMLDEALDSRGDDVRSTRPFERTCVPASLASLEAVLLARQALEPGDAEDLRQVVLAVVDVALRLGGERADSRVERSERQVRSVARVLRYLESHVAEDCSLETLASIAGLTRFHFLRVFRAVTGQTPRQLVIATRLRLAANLLRASRTRVTDIALESGFGDLSHFTMSFTRAFGISPRAYRVRALGRG